MTESPMNESAMNEAVNETEFSADEIRGQGGQYELNPETGKYRRLDAPTEHNPDGDRARNADGTPVE